MPRIGSVGILALLLSASCSKDEPRSDSDDPDRSGAGSAVTPGTRAMAELLRERTATIRPDRVLFLSDQRIAAFRERLESAGDPAIARERHIALAKELLFAGLTEDAIEAFERIRDGLVTASDEEREKLQPQVASMLAISWLRLGEQENCLARHGPDSCLLPIRGGGVHTVTRGAERTFTELEALLAMQPEHVGSRWLLNIAAMALGRWPDGVPEPFRIPPETFASEREIPRFFDVAPRVGLDVVSLSGGAVTEDFDGDGLLDVMCSAFGVHDPLRVFRNAGDGTFEERTQAAGLEGEHGGLNLLHADYDNDGFADVLVLRGAWFGPDGALPNSLLRNRGDFTFDDVTQQVGLLAFAPTQAAAFGDFDNDGWIDLFVANESTPEQAFPCELWWNRGGERFENVALELGVAGVAFFKGAAAGDYDNDGRIDLYLSVMGGPNVLLRNEPRAAGPGQPDFGFRDVTKQAGVAEPAFSFPCWFFDCDNDGFEDILVASYGSQVLGSLDDVARLHLGMETAIDRARLYRNRGDGTFEDVTKAAGLDRFALVMGANFGDLDNDGFLDCYFGTGDPDLRTLIPNRMFLNDGGRRFLDVSTAGGFGHLQKGHGIAFADLDNDGDQDVFAELGGAVSGDVYQNALFENPGFGNRWITIELKGVRSNRAGIGARIAVTVETPAGERVIRVTGGTGGSFGSSSLQQEIGLGDALRIVAIEVYWPASNTRQLYRGVGLDQKVRIEEGSAVAIPVPMRRIDFSPE
jgi:hypothetical protein